MLRNYQYEPLFKLLCKVINCRIKRELNLNEYLTGMHFAEYLPQ